MNSQQDLRKGSGIQLFGVDLSQVPLRDWPMGIAYLLAAAAYAPGNTNYRSERNGNRPYLEESSVA